MIECKFSLDLTKNGIQKTVYAKAGEQNARKLIVTLTHSGCVFVLASQEKTYSAKVFLETGENFEAEVVGNTVQAVIPNAFPEPQIRVCELRVSHGNEVIFSPMFELIIEDSLGNKAESESLEIGVRYQESLADTQVQTEEMQDQDYVMIYDESKGIVMRLPWSEVSHMVNGSVITEHKDLSGRNEENQHSINAIEGLESILEGLRKDVDLKASQESVESKAEQSEVEKLDARLNSQINGVNADLGNRIDIVESNTFSTFEDVYQRLENLSPGGGAGITPGQAQAIEDNTKARHTHDNKSVLDNLDEENGVLTYNGNTIGGSGTVERPTGEYIYDFVNDEEGRLWYTSGADLIFYMPTDYLREEEQAIIGKEIADIEFELSPGEWVSLKNASERDLIAVIPLINHILPKVVEDTDAVVFAAMHYPSLIGWLNDAANSNMLLEIRITYYTD